MAEKKLKNGEMMVSGKVAQIIQKTNRNNELYYITVITLPSETKDGYGYPSVQAVINSTKFANEGEEVTIPVRVTSRKYNDNYNSTIWYAG